MQEYMNEIVRKKAVINFNSGNIYNPYPHGSEEWKVYQEQLNKCAIAALEVEQS